MVVKLALKRKNENIQIWSRYSLFKNTGCSLLASSSAALTQTRFPHRKPSVWGTTVYRRFPLGRGHKCKALMSSLVLIYNPQPVKQRVGLSKQTPQVVSLTNTGHSATNIHRRLVNTFIQYVIWSPGDMIWHTDNGKGYIAVPYNTIPYTVH